MSLTLWYGADELNFPCMYRSTKLVLPPYSFPNSTTFKSTRLAISTKHRKVNTYNIVLQLHKSQVIHEIII